MKIMSDASTTRMTVWGVIALALVSAREILGDERPINVSSRELNVFPGFKLALYDDELRVKLNLEEIFEVTAVQSRTHDHGEEDKKPGLQKFGSMIIMIPLIMQMLSLPGAIASIKMSLLKSLVVGKLALLLMVFNMLRNQQPSEVVVVHQSPPQHHDHYYPHFHEDYEDDDKGWFG